MYVFNYLRFNFKSQDFVIRLPIKAEVRPTGKTCKNVKCVHARKCSELRVLFADNKVRFAFARAEQLVIFTFYDTEV